MRLQPANFDYIDPNWKPLTASIPVLKDTDPKELGYGGRGYQVRWDAESKGKRRTVLKAPTGSGKSLMMVFHSAREIIESDYRQKQVFLVPQLNIGNGFSEYRHKKLLVDGSVYGWEITTNCCYDNERSVSRIRDFLLSDRPCKSYRANKILGGCTAVASYAAFLAAWRRATSSERLEMIRNASFRVDEFHHALGVCEGALANQLGTFCQYLLDNDGSLHSATATFFRSSEKEVIIGDEYLKSFFIFAVPFLEFWKLTGLRSFHQSFQSYKDSDDLQRQILASIAAEPDQRPIVIVPPDGVKFFKLTDKWEWVKSTVRGMEDTFGKGSVLDLVSQDTKERDKQRLISEKQDFDGYLTCMVGKEGTDWPPCSRIYNTVLDANVLQPIQKIGRALRPSDGKVDVRMINYVKHFDKWDSDVEDIRERLSDRFNAVAVASMYDDMFYPILFPTLPRQESGEKPTEKPKMVSLEDVYGSKRNELIQDMIRRLLSIPASERTAEAVDEIIDDIIEEYQDGILEEVPPEVLKDRLRKEIVRRQNPSNPDLRLDGFVVDFIRENGWDKVVREHVAPGSPFMGEAKTEDLVQLQKFLSKSDWMENVEQIKKIGIKNVEKGSRLYHFLLHQRRAYRATKAAES